MHDLKSRDAYQWTGQLVCVSSSHQLAHHSVSHGAGRR